MNLNDKEHGTNKHYQNSESFCDIGCYLRKCTPTKENTHETFA